MEDSVFTKIIKREIPGTVLYENDHVIAFLDINPVNPGHTLVVPKSQQPNVLESSEQDVIEVMKAARMLAPVIVKAVEADGFNFTTNTGAAAGQSVFHTHFHIIPRFENDGHELWKHVELSAEQMKEVAEKIKAEL